MYTQFLKCQTSSKPNSISYDYKFHCLPQVEEEKDLGIIVDHKLNFRKHISSKVNKANNLIFLIKHSFKYHDANMFNFSYKSLIRPHLEYTSEVWSPSFKMDINSLEKVQRRATRLVPAIAELPYEERLHHLQLPTLHYHRLRSDLILIFKLTHNMLSLNMLTYYSVC